MEKREKDSDIYNLVSRLIKNNIILSNLRNIILFGSVSRGDYNENSDINIFIDIKNIKFQLKVKDILNKVVNDYENEVGNVKFRFNIIVSDLSLEKWNSLKKEIKKSYKILYSDNNNGNKGINKILDKKIIISYDIKKLNQKDKVSFLRRLYGYKQIVNNKKYVQRGLLDDISGKKLGVNSILIYNSEKDKIIILFKKYKIRFETVEVYI